MSLNIVDIVSEFSNQHTIGLIPSRRQVEWTGGYVNNWKTHVFSDYVRGKNTSVILERDHAGPYQGYAVDDGLESLRHDASHFDIIHIDPWKKYPQYFEGLKSTVDCIKYVNNINPDVCFEIGTEETIRKFSVEDLEAFIRDVKHLLPESLFEKIKYVVVQSGVKLDLGKRQNVGDYDSQRLEKMVQVCNQFNVFSKEHNGDYLNTTQLKERFDLGLDAVNIAPEFGQLETFCWLKEFNVEQTEKFYDICYASRRWEKWVGENFIPEENKEELIKICGHYVFSSSDFCNLKSSLPCTEDIEQHIKTTIRNKLEQLYEI